MSAETILDEIGDEQGWNDSSKLSLCLQYIENQGSDSAFEDFLRIQAEEENGPIDYIGHNECRESGQHLTSCDDDGFCNSCGHQET